MKYQYNIVFVLRLLIECFKIFGAMIAYLEVYQLLWEKTLRKFYLLFVEVLELQLWGLAFNVLIFGLDFPFYFCGKICDFFTMKTVENLELGYKNCLIIHNGVIALACLFFYDKQAK